MTISPPPGATPSAATTYQVGVFALVQHRGAYLFVQPRKLLLPGGNISVPGVFLNQESGSGVAETQLRRTLLSQVGLAVGDLRLVGSYAGRGTEDGRADARLHLIFGTEYCSGILNPQPAELHGAEWIAREHLLERGVPEWLLAAIREMENSMSAPREPVSTPTFRLGLGRRR